MSGSKRILSTWTRVRKTRVFFYLEVIIGAYCLLTWAAAGLTYIFMPLNVKRLVLSPIVTAEIFAKKLPPDPQFQCFIFLLLVAMIIVAAVMNKRKPGTFGTAMWHDKFEGMADDYRTPGVLLGKKGLKPVIMKAGPKDNRNVIVFGPPEVGKSRCYVRPNMFHAVLTGRSVVVTDPKGELTADFLQYFKDKGYETRIFDVKDFIHSDRWNPLDEIMDLDVDTQIFCDTIIQATQVPGRKKGDEFWERVEMNLLKALTLYVKKEYPRDEQHIGSIYDLIAIGSEAALEAKFNVLPVGHPAVAPFNIYRSMPANVKAGAIAGLGTRLQVFQNQRVRDFTATSDISLALLGKKKCAYFCILSDAESAYYFLASLFFSFLFRNLMRFADQNGGTLPVPVEFLLDEFCNIGNIPDFARKLSTMRSRGIGCSIIIQSLPQLKEHTDDWETILANCKTWLVMGVNDETTAKYLSDYIGDTTIETKAFTKKVGHPFDWGSEKKQENRRKLLNPDEVVRIPANKEIVLIRGQFPVEIEKMDFTKHPESKYLKPIDLRYYVPKWYKPKQFYIEKIDKISKEEMPKRIQKEIVKESSQAIAEEKPDQSLAETNQKKGTRGQSFWKAPSGPPTSAKESGKR